MTNIPVITVPAFAAPEREVSHFFGTRRHAAALDLELGTPVREVRGATRSAWMLSVKQVHGTDALVVDRALTGADRFQGGWDALVTDQPGIMVAVRTADCVPVLMYDPVSRVVAALHAGWRGAVAGIVPKTIALMQSRFGSNPEQVRVSIGPSAGVCCYEVDEPVLDGLRASVNDWEALTRNRRGSKAHLDLKALVSTQAQAAGIPRTSVTTVNLCTICHEDLFFSYRREGKVRGAMVSAIGLAPMIG
ncbi:MAG TPA: peptidoglycan editing factor PgeF [Nitrospira sp.]|jgi:YfiH family protein|nr:peptidoglycan editing factor PgeF [Nitrospira sp.]